MLKPTAAWHYEGVSFKIAAVLKFNSCDVFSDAKEYQHLWPEAPPELRRARLAELYNLCAQYKTS